MTRVKLAALAASATAAVLGLAADPKPSPSPVRSAAPLELALPWGDAPARIEVRAAADGVPLSAVWDETFAKLFAHLDRNDDGALDTKEAATAPSAKAVRQAMGSGFVPPSGPAPSITELDRDGDGKVSPGELAAYYRANGVGNVVVGVGRLPATAALTAALVKYLDANGDGRVSESEWRAAADALRKLDANDDELIGAGELVPGAVYPGTAGAERLTPPTADATGRTLSPVVLLPDDPKDAAWGAELTRRGARSGTDWPAQEPAGRWAADVTGTPGNSTFRVTVGGVRLDGWVARGRAAEAAASARERIVAEFEGGAVAEERPARRPGSSGLAWLVPTADRNGDGTLDRTELDAWLDLQAQIVRGQALLTVLDGGGLFEVLDADHDGALSPRELRTAYDRVRDAGALTGGAFDPARSPRVVLAVLSHGYPRTIATARAAGPAWFRAMDKNGDGDVSRREFTGPPAAFARLDADGDGLVSSAEAGRAKP